VKNRSKVANYAADALINKSVDRKELVNTLAAWLKDTKQTRSASYLVDDIAKKLIDANYVYVSVTTAHPITEQTRSNIDKYLRQHFGKEITLEINEKISSKIIGGVLIETPMGSLDATVKRKLIQIIKGVQ
jgi:F0F1-type ATP synthase delta subunit